MHIPKEILLTVLPKIILLLRTENFVVHSYAATLIERLVIRTEHKGSMYCLSLGWTVGYLDAFLD